MRNRMDFSNINIIWIGELPHLCECGCELITNEGARFVKGHWAKINCDSFKYKGPSWNKGLTKETDERVKKNAENNREPHLGKPGYWQDKQRYPETIKLISGKVINNWQDPMYKEKQRIANLTRMTEEVIEKIRTSKMGSKASEETKKLMSKSRKTYLATLTDEERGELIKRSMASSSIRPNKPETILLNLLDNLYPNEWKYTGDFSFWINGKNPDFANVNGQKKLIEMFGDYYHQGENPQDRIDIFKPFGYETLVIWEKELKDIEMVKSKISEFSEMNHARQ